MIKGINKTIILLLLICLASCRASRPPVTPVPAVPSSGAVSASAEAYINNYKDLAIREMKRSGVPASITLAQGMLESDYGRSPLARMGNNHFGIKCHNDWKGPTIMQHDDSQNDCFRKYQKVEDSYRDHSNFLRTGSRYNFLFELEPTDYKAWAHGLKKAGYATNPQYAALLIKKIEENSLYNIDHEGYTSYVMKKPEVIHSNSATSVQKRKNRRKNNTLDNTLNNTANNTAKNSTANNTAYKPGNTTNDRVGNGYGNTVSDPAPEEGTITFGEVMARVPRIMENNKIQYIVVKDGDTREKIEKEFQLLKWELPKYNELKTDFKIVPGQILYLQSKREKAESGKEFHIAAGGETMYMISQIYGIKLASLLEMNRMGDGAEPVAGQKIWLQKTKPLN